MMIEKLTMTATKPAARKKYSAMKPTAMKKYSTMLEALTCGSKNMLEVEKDETTRAGKGFG